MNHSKLLPGSVLRPAAAGAHDFVLLGATSSGQHLLAAAWTTLDEECPDDECVLGPEDHPEITHASAVAFSRARLWEASKLQQAVSAGLVRITDPLPESVFRRVVESAALSRNLRREWKPLLPKL